MNNLKAFFTALSCVILLLACSKEQAEPVPQCDDPDFDVILSYTAEIEAGSASVEIGNAWGAPMSSLSFKWSNGDSGPALYNVEPGIYTVTVTNEQNCSVTKEVDLSFNNTTSGHQVGDEGPAGGIIFHVFSDGSALEAAPASTIESNVQWGCSGTSINTSQDRGSGQANTDLILNGCSQSGIAAAICDGLVVNGYSDWYLPSIGDLDALAYAVYQDNPGNYPTGQYWSSSETIASMAYRTVLPDGGSEPVSKGNGLYVIAVRDVAAP